MIWFFEMAAADPFVSTLFLVVIALCYTMIACSVTLLAPFGPLGRVVAGTFWPFSMWFVLLLTLARDPGPEVDAYLMEKREFLEKRKREFLEKGEFLEKREFLENKEKRGK